MLRFLLFLCCVLTSVSPGVEAVLVDLNAPNTYGALFDAGLRPRKGFRENIDGLLEIRPPQEIGFRISEKQIPAIKAIWSFDIANNDQINVIRGVVEDAWTKAEAFENTRELEAALGGDVTALKQWINSYPTPSETGDLWGRRWRSPDGTRSVKYYFRHTMQDARPLTISVSIELRWPGRKRGFRETPLKPPAGYENVDISFDETYGGTKSTPLPLTTERIANNVSTDQRTSSQEKKNSIEALKGTLNSSKTWSIIVVLIVAALCLMWVLMKQRK